MPAHGVIQSPVLVGRDAYLTLFGERLADAAAGTGRLLFVAGEAGIGKTRLLGSAARHARASGFAVVRAAAFPGDAQSLAGLLLDMASGLMPAREPALSDLGRSLASRLRTIPAADGDAHHRRRLLVQDLADLIVAVDPGAPVLIILEDLHWADELSLDVLGHLASRVADRPMLVAGTYRSDELYPQLAMRDLRARLLGQRAAEEIRLPRLGLHQTAVVASAVLGLPVPAQAVAAIYQRSDGIPRTPSRSTPRSPRSSGRSRNGPPPGWTRTPHRARGPATCSSACCSTATPTGPTCRRPSARRSPSWHSGSASATAPTASSTSSGPTGSGIPGPPACSTPASPFTSSSATPVISRRP